MSSVIGLQQIEALPINGRNFIGFAVVTPGVVTDRTPLQGAVATSSLSFTGQRARSNNVMVDGLDNNDPVVGAVRATFSQEAIREFQVLVDSYSAEFGKAAGGVINIVTKSGTNEYHGNAFGYFRDRALNAKTHFDTFDIFGQPIDREKPPFTQQQWGGTLGGPVRLDRTFFFGSAERTDVTDSRQVSIDPAAAAVIEAAGFPVALGNVPAAVENTELFGKVDHHWGQTDSTLTLRGTVQLRTDWSFSAAETDIIANRWINELRVQFADEDQQVNALDPAATSSAPSPRSASRRRSMACAKAFPRRTCRATAILFPEERYDDLSLFAQDEWKRGRVVLRPGVRYQRQFWQDVTYRLSDVGGGAISYPLAADRNNIAPRLGVSYDVTGNGRTIAHGSYGVFYDNVAMVVENIGRVLNGTPEGIRTLVVPAPRASIAWNAPGHRLTEAEVTALNGGVPPPSLVLAPEPGLTTSYTHQASIGVDRALTSDLAISVNGVFVRGFELPGTIDHNPVLPARLGAGRRLDGFPEFVHRAEQRLRTESRRSVRAAARVRSGVGARTGDARSAAAPGVLRRLRAAVATATFGDLHGGIGPSVHAARGRGSQRRWQWPAQVNVDLRVNRRFPLGSRVHVDAIVEAFNLFDRVNFVEDTNQSSFVIFGTGACPSEPLPAYGRYTLALPPRQVQLALKSVVLSASRAATNTASTRSASAAAS